MKTLTLSLLATISTITLSAQSVPGEGWDEVFASSSRSTAGRIGGAGSSMPAVRRDVVGADFQPATSSSIILMRETRRTANGYEVKVKAADGSLRMKGTYSDAQLTIANGSFSYYHDNGRLESEGNYVNGVKSGVWLRFDRAGNPKAEKVYGGQTYDQMAATFGWSAAANN